MSNFEKQLVTNLIRKQINLCGNKR